MSIRRSTIGTLALAILALAGLGLSAAARAEHHGGGGTSGGSAGHAAPSAHVSHGGSGFRPSGAGSRGAGIGHSPSGWVPGARGWAAPAAGWAGGRRQHIPEGRPRFGGGRPYRGWDRPWGGYWYGSPFLGFLPVLPWYASTYWWGGVPYYYADNTYYLWNDGAAAYEVVDPPPHGNDAVESGDVALDAYVYPKAGQSSEQQASDRYTCHRWAADQTGFDPTRTGGGVASDVQGDRRGAYHRAEAACLEGRGYTVR